QQSDNSIDKENVNPQLQNPRKCTKRLKSSHEAVKPKVKQQC
ncbi:6756_t:CDS:2, partial [Cetraspora pellucida]